MFPVSRVSVSRPASPMATTDLQFGDLPKDTLHWGKLAVIGHHVGNYDVLGGNNTSTSLETRC
jgi:hypothetical protein